MNEKKIFDDFCFSPNWLETENLTPKTQEQIEIVTANAPQRKELSVLLGELEEIKNNIENIKAKEWQLAKLVKFHKMSFT